MKLKLFLITTTLLLSSAAFASEGRSFARWDSNGDRTPTPVSVPEPSTLVLAGTSLVGLLGAAVRRSRG